MNPHLREEDICRWIAGERSREMEQHLEDCIKCRSHMARMSEVLGAFHDSVHDRVERSLAGVGASPARGESAFGWGRMAAVLAALLLVVAASLSWHRASWHRAVPTPAIDDAALLRRVDADVSRTVPGPMEPLAALMPQSIKSQEER